MLRSTSTARRHPNDGPTDQTTGVTPMPTQDMHEQADEIEQAVASQRAEQTRQ